MPSRIEPTGERVIEEHYLSSRQGYLIYLFHIVTYQFSIPHVSGRRVLDFGCGTGYGTAMLAPHCDEIVGIDISNDAISYARDHHSLPNLRFDTIGPIEKSPLPFESESFDAVVSFQVIEHVPDVQAYLSEIRRVLRPGGCLVLATPDRTTRLFRGQQPWNRFHLTEYDTDQIEYLFQDHFSDVELLSMGGREDVIAKELRRTHTLKWITLPFTFPGAPESWRQLGLGLLGMFRSRPVSEVNDRPWLEEMSEDDIAIEKSRGPGVNIIAVAIRPHNGRGLPRVS